MGTLHTLATEQYTEHYARMNPTLDAAQMPRRVYRNMELMYGHLVNALPQGSLVGDLGCGTGFLLHWLSDKQNLRIKGVDACESQVALAHQAAPAAEISCGDALEFLRGRNETFSVLFCMDMLEHIEEDEQCLALVKLARASLKPGGVFVCRVPNAAHILGSYSRYMDLTHRRGFTSHSLRQLFRAARFEATYLLPTRSSSLAASIRLSLEHVLHRSIFLLGGYTCEDTFTQNVVGIAVKTRLGERI